MEAENTSWLSLPLQPDTKTRIPMAPIRPPLSRARSALRPPGSPSSYPTPASPGPSFSRADEHGVPRPSGISLQEEGGAGLLLTLDAIREGGTRAQKATAPFPGSHSRRLCTPGAELRPQTITRWSHRPLSLPPGIPLHPPSELLKKELLLPHLMGGKTEAQEGQWWDEVAGNVPVPRSPAGSEGAASGFAISGGMIFRELRHPGSVCHTLVSH